MNHDKLNEFLAVEIMGWTLRGTSEPVEDAGHTWYECAASGEQISIHLWAPSTNIEQAIMCLEKMDHWACDRIHDKYQIYAVSETGQCLTDRYESFAYVASLACAGARGFEE